MCYVVKLSTEFKLINHEACKILSQMPCIIPSSYKTLGQTKHTYTYLRQIHLSEWRSIDPMTLFNNFCDIRADKVTKFTQYLLNWYLAAIAPKKAPLGIADWREGGGLFVVRIFPSFIICYVVLCFCDAAHWLRVKRRG